MAYSDCGPIICHKRDCGNPQYFVKLKTEEELLAMGTIGRCESIVSRVGLTIHPNHNKIGE